MLKSALDPASIAIVGASDNPHKVGGRPLLYLKRYGYRGRIYPVNPARGEVQGVRAFTAIADLPEAPELAVVAVAGDEAVHAVEACAARGVKVAVVMTSGFSETGEAGRAKQDRMLAAARAGGMRLIGPNCQGLANFATGTVATSRPSSTRSKGATARWRSSARAAPTRRRSTSWCATRGLASGTCTPRATRPT